MHALYCCWQMTGAIASLPLIALSLQRGFGIKKAYSRRSGKAPDPVAGKQRDQTSTSAAAAARAAAESASQAAAALLAEEEQAEAASKQAKQQSSAKKARQRQRKQVSCTLLHALQWSSEKCFPLET